MVGPHRNDQGQPSRWKNGYDALIELAHRLDRGWLYEVTFDKYLTVVTSLRWLLTGVLLLETGLAANDLSGA